MSLAAVRRASNPSQPKIVTEIRYSSRNSTARDHVMITVMQPNTSLPPWITSFGMVQEFALPRDQGFLGGWHRLPARLAIVNIHR
jgi:hypothetical protein